jgi:hypothetical protein
MTAVSRANIGTAHLNHLDFEPRAHMLLFRFLMANEEAKRNLKLLASRVQGRPTTLTEDSRLEQELQARQPTTREAVKGVLSESLSKNASDVNRILANSDDSDRLIDEIARALGK